MRTPTPIDGLETLHSVRPARELKRTLRTLKHGETFAVLDEYGDLNGSPTNSEGLYHLGTRFLSVGRLLLCGRPPLLLGSAVSEDNTMLAVDMANAGTDDLAADTLHLSRAIFVWSGALYQRFRITNYGEQSTRVEVEIDVAADFADIFEVRGETRDRRGQREPPVEEGGQLVFRYTGVDGLARTLRIGCESGLGELMASGLLIAEDVEPGCEWTFSMSARCESAEQPLGRAHAAYDVARGMAETDAHRRLAALGSIRTSNQHFDLFLARSAADVALMLSETDTGLYPHAGVPWFNAVFGRDGIITALETLWIEPSIARGVLEHLAATQARGDDPSRDAEPGKIVHEQRHGEMANCGEVPFGRYYGSVDATALYICLAGAYYQRTGDGETIARVWPNLVAAMVWIDRKTSEGGDPFLRYQRAHSGGLANQGWKDSWDAVFHRDGSMARAPIALCEVQAYVYAARRSMAELCRARGDDEQAAEQERRASELRHAFERRFWSDELATYALAIDGDDRRCDVRASNAGHCLFFEIAPVDHAHLTAQTLMSQSMFSGWGVRTIAIGESRYNPMSYHNGSVWPHDTAIVGAGLARYGLKRDALRVLTGMFDASRFFELQRLPELLCGFERRPGQGPTRYPVACSPQAWAAGAVFMLLEACLGLSIDARSRLVSCDRPQLPPWVDWVSVEGLEVGPTRLDLVFRRTDADVSVSVAKLTRDREPEVVVIKRV